MATFKQICEKVPMGTKLRRHSWKINQYIYYDFGLMTFVTESGEIADMSRDILRNPDWEVYKEPAYTTPTVFLYRDSLGLISSLTELDGRKPVGSKQVTITEGVFE